MSSGTDISKGSFGAGLSLGPFAQLRRLLDPITSTVPVNEQINLTLGEPHHAPPAFVLEYLSQAALSPENSYAKYPPIGGLDYWREAVLGWLIRRFGITGLLAEASQILPVSGTREGLFLVAQLARPNQAGKNLMAMPNPFYQVYAAAARAAGAKPLYLNATAATGFLPDLDSLSNPELTALRAFFMCSPANPQGAIAAPAYIDRLLELAEKYDFLIIMDECYADIYDRCYEKTPPVSALARAAHRKEGAKNLIVFHSLSKRSNLPGLRSGFCAGGAQIMEAFYQFRLIAAPQTPIATLNAAALAWQDDAHAASSRALYQEKIDIAEEILGNQFDFYRPQGGFFLWLNVQDGETAAKTLWLHTGVKVLPGSYLSQPDKTGNPGAAFIRIALVENSEKTAQALTKTRECLNEHRLT